MYESDVQQRLDELLKRIETNDVQLTEVTNVALPISLELGREAHQKAMSDIITGLMKNTHVKKLDLGGIDDNHALQMAKLFETNNSITHISITYSPLSSAGIHTLLNALKLNTSVTSVRLSHVNYQQAIFSNYIDWGNLGAEHIESLIDCLKDNYSITHLNLEGNKILDENGAKLAGLVYLKSIDLSDNKLRDKTAKAFANNSTLTALELSQNNITDAGAIELAKNPCLRKLSLSFNKIGDKGAQALAENPFLQELYLAGNHIKMESANQFLQNETITSKLWIAATDSTIPKEDAEQIERVPARNRQFLQNQATLAAITFLQVCRSYAFKIPDVVGTILFMLLRNVPVEKGFETELHLSQRCTVLMNCMLTKKGSLQNASLNGICFFKAWGNNQSFFEKWSNQLTPNQSEILHGRNACNDKNLNKRMAEEDIFSKRDKFSK